MHNILFLLIGIVLACIVLNGFTNYMTVNKSEKFVDNYYHWNWNYPHLIKDLNKIDNRIDCPSCTYSMSCDFTDDAQPFCYRSLDIPTLKLSNFGDVISTNSY